MESLLKKKLFAKLYNILSFFSAFLLQIVTYYNGRYLLNLADGPIKTIDFYPGWSELLTQEVL